MSFPAQSQPINLNHNALYVADLAVSAAFYKNVMGLQKVEDPFKDELHAWFEIGDGVTIHLIQGAKENIKQYRFTHGVTALAI